MRNFVRFAKYASVPVLFGAGSAMAADYTGLTIDLTGADAAIIGIGTAVLGVLGVLLVIKLVKASAR